MIAKSSSKFSLGQVVATPRALEALDAVQRPAIELLNRHVTGDWGDLDDEDKQANDRALLDGGRLLSAYLLRQNTKIWIISEADRSATTILLPKEY